MSELEIGMSYAIAGMALIIVYVVWYGRKATKENQAMYEAYKAKDAQLAAAGAEVTRLTRESAALTAERDDACQRAGSLCGELVTARCRNGALEDEIERLTREAAALTEEHNRVHQQLGLLVSLANALLVAAGRGDPLPVPSVEETAQLMQKLTKDLVDLASAYRMSDPDVERAVSAVHFPVLYMLVSVASRYRRERDEARTQLQAETAALPAAVQSRETAVDDALRAQRQELEGYQHQLDALMEAVRVTLELCGIRVNPDLADEGAHHDQGSALVDLSGRFLGYREMLERVRRVTTEEWFQVAVMAAANTQMRRAFSTLPAAGIVTENDSAQIPPPPLVPGMARKPSYSLQAPAGTAAAAPTPESTAQTVAPPAESEVLFNGRDTVGFGKPKPPGLDELAAGLTAAKKPGDRHHPPLTNADLEAGPESHAQFGTDGAHDDRETPAVTANPFLVAASIPPAPPRSSRTSPGFPALLLPPPEGTCERGKDADCDVGSRPSAELFPGAPGVSPAVPATPVSVCFQHNFVCKPLGGYESLDLDTD